MTRLETALRHLLMLLAPPYTQGWRLYVWSEAKRMASDPELAELPARLTEESKRLLGSTSQDQ